MNSRSRPAKTSQLADTPRQERAVAIQYHDVGQIPRVLASGVGEVARRIIKIAEQHGIPLYRDGALAELLGKLEWGALISPDTYRLVAEVICFLYYTDQEWRAKHSGLAPLIKFFPQPVADETECCK